MDQSYFPLFINLQSKKILMVGGGQVASRRAAVLLDFTDHITLISPDLSESLNECVKKEKITWYKKEFEETDLVNADLVMAATNDSKSNDMITKLCKKHHIPVNHAGDRTQCDFYFPGIIKQDNLVIGVTASGQNHRLAKTVTNNIKKLLEEPSCYNDQED